MKRLARSNECYRESFHDYSPLLFISNTTLHTNLPVSIDCSGPRLTLLAHFFDPSPKYGKGALCGNFGIDKEYKKLISIIEATATLSIAEDILAGRISLLIFLGANM